MAYSGISMLLDAGNRKSFTSIANGWKDLSGSFGNLSFSGAAYDTDGGGSISFGGGGSASSLSMSAYQQTTWSVWTKKASNPAGGELAGVFGHTAAPYLAFRSNGVLHFSYKLNFGGANSQYNLYTASDKTAPTGTLYTYSNDVWYNVVCTLSMNIFANQDSEAKIYVNGANVISNTTLGGTSDQMPTYNGIKIGSIGGAQNLNGKVSSLRVYRRILTDAEILRNYEAQRARFGV